MAFLKQFVFLREDIDQELEAFRQSLYTTEEERESNNKIWGVLRGLLTIDDLQRLTVEQAVERL